MMYLKSFAILIISVGSFRVGGFPSGNNGNINERLDPRDLFGDYVPSWLWSSKNSEEEFDEKSEIINNHTDSILLGNTPSQQNNVSEFQPLGPQLNGDHNLALEEIKPIREIPIGVQLENVDKILEEIREDVKTTNDEEKAKTLNLWKSLTDTVSKTTSPYVEVVYKNARHIIDIGGFGSSKRSRCFGEMANPFSGILAMIFSMLFGQGSSPLMGLVGAPASSSSSSSASAGAFAGAGNPGGVRFVSIQDIEKMRNGQQPPAGFNLGIGTQPGISADDILKLRGGSQVAANPGTGDANNMLLMALLLRLLGKEPKGKDDNDFEGLDLSKLKLPGGEDDSALISVLKQLKKQPDTRDGGNNKSRVIVIKKRMEDLDDSDDSESNPFEIFSIRGTPEERFRRISKKFKNNPDTREKIIIVDELNRLKNESDIDEELEELIKKLERKIKADRSYDDIFEIARLTSDGKRKPRKFKNIEFIDGSGKKFSRGFSGDDDDDEKLLNELIGTVTSKYKTKNMNDPKTLREFLKNLNLRTLEE